MKSLPKFRHLGDLYKLDLSHTLVENISLVSQMPNLERLFLQGSRVSDLSPAKGLKHLREIDASDTLVDQIPSGNGDLNRVRLNRTKVTDVSPLANTQNLYHSHALGYTRYGYLVTGRNAALCDARCFAHAVD